MGGQKIGFSAVLRRELKMFMSHRTFSRLSIALPLFAFLLFVLMLGKGVATDIPVAVLDHDNSSLSRQLIRMMEATQSSKVAYNITDMAEGERMMKQGLIEAVIEIPAHLEKNIYSNTQSTVGMYINGLNLTKNGLLYKDLSTVMISFSSGIQMQTLVKQGVSEVKATNLMMPIYFEKHVLFNPYINYGYYLLPGFLAIMLMMFVLITTVFTIGMELKDGTAGKWFETAGSNTFVAIGGKLLPYTLIFFAFCMLMNTILFKFLGVPLEGNAAMIFIAGLVFILAFQSIGIFMIVLFCNMRLALSIGGGYSVLAFTFSGLTFPFLAMGPIMHTIGYIFPLTYYMEIFIDQAMRGTPVVNSVDYLGYMMLFLLLPLIMLPRFRKICTDPKYWGRL